MSTTDLIPLKRTGLEIAITQEFIAAKTDLMGQAAMIMGCNTDPACEMVTTTLDHLANMRRSIERARKELKEPFLAAGNDIDSCAKKASEGLTDEEFRLSRMAGDYRAVQAARQRAIERLASRDDLSPDERVYHESVAAVTSIEQIDAIQAAWNAANAAKGAPAMETSSAAGTEGVKTELEVVVADIHALYRSHPGCVELTPRLSVIKEVIESGSGAILRGVAWKRVNVVKASRAKA